MPKPSNTLAIQGSNHTSAMLNQDNLAQHTQHHQELDESRDFVREFLDTLDPSSAPQSDPGLEPVELTPGIVLRSPSIESKPRGYDSPQRSNIRLAQQQQTSQHQRQHQHQNQNQQLRQNKHQQRQPQIQGQQQQVHSNSPDKSKRKKVSKEHQESHKRTHHEPQPILQDNRKHPASTTRREEGNGAAGKDDMRQSKKRKQDADDVEQGVQDLEIRGSHSTNSPSSRNKRKPKNRLAQDGRHASNQQDEGRRKYHGKRVPLHDLVDNRSVNNDENHHNRNHRHQYHHQHHLVFPALRYNSNSTVKDNAGKKDSNKPRKILTQGSLIMNIPGKTDHLGIFRKGKASKKTIVQRDVGNEFSEDAFLNQRTDSRASRASRRRHEQVVTSAYFTDANQNDHTAASKSSSSYSNKSIHEQSKSPSAASSVQNPNFKSAGQKRAVASTHRASRHARGYQGASSYHSSASSNQQRLKRINTYESAPTTTHATTSEQLEDVLDPLLETNGSSPAQSPPQVNPIEFDQPQPPVPVEYLPTADTYVDPYVRFQLYEYATPLLAPWQLNPYQNVPDPHQQMYAVYDLPAPILPACPTIPEQHLQPIEYDVDNDDTEYGHGLPLDGHLPQSLPPPLSTYFRWRPHRLF
ncbi:hypothetical protein BG015_001175 [Linnemannia schmuckeri]|uniref:Uncharacterized protein n=1 Tax=Linnemannia schmuckeri TaxID=64567 RepID=A0A9P5V6Z4_9FUNG|nr:hypothetical protein BG015_001175 [Linnemannia schmuckeri]